MSKFSPVPDFDGAPAQDTPEYAFERIAAGWFDVDPLTIRKWVAAKDQLSLIPNLQSVFVAGYRLGSEQLADTREAYLNQSARLAKVFGCPPDALSQNETSKYADPPEKQLAQHEAFQAMQPSRCATRIGVNRCLLAAGHEGRHFYHGITEPNS